MPICTITGATRYLSLVKDLLVKMAADKIVSMIITIDGPAASGKSTISRRVAEELGFKHLDTGAMYRALTWQAISKNINPDETKAIVRLAQTSDISFAHNNQGQVKKVFLNGKDITEMIRRPRVSQNVSQVSRIAGVRKIMVEKQREMAQRDNLVAEGRDCGTVVFPRADLKIFLTASVEERGKRRAIDLKRKGHKVNLEKIKRDIILRDKKDSSREISPLKKASDAYTLDTTTMSIEEVVEKILNLFKERC